MAGDIEDAQLLCLLAEELQAAADLPLIGKRDQPVDAVGHGGLAAAGGPRNQQLLPLADRQIDINQCGLGLGVILKTKVFKFQDRLVHPVTSNNTVRA